MSTMSVSYLINILIMEYTWPTQHSPKVFVQIVRAPEESSSTLLLNLSPPGFRAFPVKSAGYYETRRRPEQVPTVINAGASHEEKTLPQARLDVFERYCSFLTAQLMLRCLKIANSKHLSQTQKISGFTRTYPS